MTHESPLLRNSEHEHSVRRSPLVSIAVATGIGFFAYFASYVGIRLAKPECINTNDGPIAAFKLLYYPLRYLEAERPQWYSTAASHDSWLEARIDGVNRGNGYLYFTWDGHEARAFINESRDFNEGAVVLLHFTYELETWDDYTSRLVPTIDRIILSDAGAQ